MTPAPNLPAEKWPQIKALFFAALDQPTGERASFLNRQTEQDLELREIVATMLDAHQREVSGFELEPTGELYPNRFGPYRVTSLVATTLSTLVLRAERDDGQFEQTVAIKLIQPSAVSPQILYRLETERQILATLNNPAICRLLDSGQLSTGQHYLILEWIEGVPFLEHAKLLDQRAKLLLFREICLVIESAHHLLIVHRDLKPAHILVTPQGNLKILDFGIAKLLQSNSHIDSLATQPGHSPLTPAYASPEQWRGDPATPSFDIFSLGILFAELLTGQHPFGTSPALPHEWASRIHAGQPQGLRLIKGDLQAIARKALEVNPSHRYATVESFRNDIENYLDSRPLLARPNSLLHDSALWIRRNRRYLIPLTILAAFTLFELQQMYFRLEDQERRSQQAQAAARDLIFKVFLSVLGTNVPADTRRQILYAAIKQLEVWDFASQSDIDKREIATLYSQIGGNLGESFDNHLEDFPVAERCARRALNLLDSLSSSTPDERWNTAMLLADILFSHGKWAEARQAYQEVLRRSYLLQNPQSIVNRRSRTVANSMLGDILLAEGLPEQALKIQKSVLEERRQILREGGDAIDSAPTTSFLGNVHYSLAQTYAALNLLGPAIHHVSESIANHTIANATKSSLRPIAEGLLLLGDLHKRNESSALANQSWREAERTVLAMLAKEPASIPAQKILNEIRARLVHPR